MRMPQELTRHSQPTHRSRKSWKQPAWGRKAKPMSLFSVLTTDPQGNPSTYSVTADPQIQGGSERRRFYVDQTCVIRSNDFVPAGPSDLPLNLGRSIFPPCQSLDLSRQ